MDKYNKWLQLVKQINDDLFIYHPIFVAHSVEPNGGPASKD